MSNDAASVHDSSHRMQVDHVTDERRRVLIVVANPAVSSNNSWPVGFWAA
ncbi:MAG: hypothetical protein LH603_12510 [Pseudonocardia sp.]|nr:hypothetical protein [Pseudonocardia sp.]